MSAWDDMMEAAGWGSYDGPPRPTIRPAGGIDFGQPTPEDEAGLLQIAKHTLGTGLDWYQRAMDTLGGRALKGLLVGKPRELLSVLPGSDMSGLTDPIQRTSGREVLEHYGAIQHAEPGSGLDAGDVAGVGADLLLDPASYLFGPGAALSKGGQLAKAAGVLPKALKGRIGTTLGDVLQGATPEVVQQLENAAKAAGVSLKDAALTGEKLGGWGGVGSPLRRNPEAIFGTGDHALKAAEYAGQAADFVGQTKPALYAKALFNKAFRNQSDPWAQEALRRAAEPARQGEVAAEETFLKAGRAMEQAGDFSPAAQQEARRAAEGLAPNPSAAAQAGLGVAKPAFDEAFRREFEAGMPIGKVDNYWPHDYGALENPTPGFKPPAETVSGRTVQPGAGHLLHREEIFDIPGGQDKLSELVQHPQVSGPGRTLHIPGRGDLTREADFLRGDTFKWTPQTWQEWMQLQSDSADAAAQFAQLKGRVEQSGIQGLGPVGSIDRARYDMLKGLAQNSEHMLSPAQAARYNELGGQFKQSEHLADWLAGQDPRRAAEGIGLKDTPFETGTRRLAQGARNESLANSIKSIAAEYARPVGRAAAEDVPLLDFLQHAGLTGPAAEDAMRKELAAAGRNTNLAELYVPREIDTGVRTAASAGPMGDPLGKLGKGIDSFTNLFKTGVSALWPKNWVRDAGQDAMRLFTRMPPGEAADAMQGAIAATKNAGSWKNANKVAGLEHLTEEQATKALMDEAAARRGYFNPRGTRVGEEIGPVGERALKESLPGGEKRSLREMVKIDPSRPTTYNPLNIAGVGGRRETKFAPAVAAGKIKELGNEINENAQYFAMRKQGYAPDAAWDEMRKAIPDFGNLSDFERLWMKRLVPFYGWSRANLAATVPELVQHPGGAEGTLMRAAANLRSKEFVPPTAGDVLAIPLGKNEDGSERYLGRTGLQAEDALRQMGFLSSPHLALQDLNPALKIPLELMQGRQLGTDRRLSDLYGYTGNPTLDELLSQGPLSRTLSTARTASDERKGFAARAYNLLMPGAITDIGPQTKEQALRRVLEEQLGASPHAKEMSRYYVKPESLPNLTSEELLLMRKYQEEEKKAQAESRARKQTGTGR